LSGGWLKRLAIAREVVTSPAILLMDEPTNHLDVDGIVWLENLLKSEPLAYLVISHDRYFLENVTNRIVELNRMYIGGLFESEGRYSDFLIKKLSRTRSVARSNGSVVAPKHGPRKHRLVSKPPGGVCRSWKI